MQVVIKNYKSIYLSFTYFSQLLLVFILPSFLHMQFKLSHSDAFFVSLILFIISILIGYSKEINFKKIRLFPIIIVGLIFFHGIISSLFNGSFEYERFLFSLAYLMCLVFAAQLLFLIRDKLNEFCISYAVSIFFYFLLIVSFLGIFGFNISQAFGKPVFYFDEPSKFALVISPFYIYRFVKSGNYERLLISALIFELAIKLPSITLLFVLIASPVLFLKASKLLFVYLIYAFVFFISSPINNISIHILSRIPFYNLLIEAQNRKYTPTQTASQNQNQTQTHTQASINKYQDRRAIFTCYSYEDIDKMRSEIVLEGFSTQSLDVYYSGWLRGLLNFASTRGFGLGFQQLGFRGCYDLFLIRYWPLNLKDGATVGAKLFNEIGLFGILFFYFYSKSLIAKVINIRNISVNYKKFLLRKPNNIIIFLDIAYISYFVNLFIRGAGYFDASSFLFVISLFFLTRRLKFKDEK